MAEIKNFPNNADEFIGAENVMKWLHGRTSGVFGAADNLAVTADDGLSVSVSDGIGWIANDEADGTVFWNDSEQENGTKLSLPIELPNALYPRIDRVVVSWETINYVAKPSIEILTGTAASIPVPPSLTNNNLMRQISLAQIYVPEAASKIGPDNITDERLNEDVCGLVTASIGVDTSVMQAQFLALLSKIESELAKLNAGTEAMLKTEYDPDGAVLAAGGIAAYTAAASSLKMDLLWANASPTSEFAEQIINLGIDLSRYNYLLFEWHEYISYENCFYSQITGYNAGLVTVATINNMWRTYSVQENNSILFQNAYSNGINNSYMIPIRIWGVR